MSMSAYSPLGRLLKNTHPAGPRTAVPIPINCLPAHGEDVSKYPVPLSSITPDKSAVIKLPLSTSYQTISAMTINKPTLVLVNIN